MNTCIYIAPVKQKSSEALVSERVSERDLICGRTRYKDLHAVGVVSILTALNIE